MGVVIRLARYGCRNRPNYRIVVGDKKRTPTGRHVEMIGSYDPLPKRDPHSDEGTSEKGLIKHLLINFERAKYWIAMGAQPSDSVARLFSYAGLIPPKPRVNERSTKAFIPKAEREDVNS